MFATFNLQLTPTATLDAAPENPTGLPVLAADSMDAEVSGFARLLQFQADAGTEATVPRGDFVPAGGNILPQAESIPTTSEDLPTIDVAASLVADADVEAPVAEILPGWTPAQAVADAPAEEVAIGIPLTPKVVATQTGGTQQEAKPQGPQTPVVPRTVSEPILVGTPKPQAPPMTDTAQTIPSPVAAAPIRDLLQPDRRDMMIVRNEQPTVAREIAAAPQSIISPEAEVVARVAPTLESSLVPDRSAPAVSTLAGAVSQLAGSATRDPGLVAQTATDLVRTPVSDPAWGERIGQRIVMMAGNQLQQAEIRLTPAELGPVRVQIAVEDGATNITFQAQHAVTREAIEAAMPRLREMLAETGLSLGQANVGGDSVAEGQREQREASNAAAGAETTADLAEDDQPERQKTVTSDGLIDTFA